MKMLLRAVVAACLLAALPGCKQILGLHERSARDFFDALVALGMLERQGDKLDSLTWIESETNRIAALIRRVRA